LEDVTSPVLSQLLKKKKKQGVVIWGGMICGAARA